MLSLRMINSGLRCLFLGLGLLILPLASCGQHNGNSSAKPSDTGLPVTITGTVQYEDRTYDSTGFTGTANLPVRKAVVEVIRDSDGGSLTSGATAQDGTYSLTFTNTGTAGVYIRVKARSSDDTVSVQNGPFQYSIVSVVMDDTAATTFQKDLTATVSNGGGQFNILDTLQEGAEFVEALAGTIPSLVTANWAIGSCDGTYFDPSDDTIHILGGCLGDTDEYDDPVLLHEYGHFVLSNYSNDDSPGEVHFLSDNTQDLRLSWSEGWGSFFSSVVRNDPVYMDTSGTTAQIAFELEGLSLNAGLNTEAKYTSNELSVAVMLWDIFDNTPAEVLVNAGGMDNLSAGIGPIWDVATNYLCPACPIVDVSFEDYWDGWFARGQGFQPQMETLMADRLMALTADAFEVDDTVGAAQAITVGGPAQTHTLYGPGDLDYVNFSATAGLTYTIETLNLNNGSDTSLELFDTDQSTSLDTNDDSMTVSTKILNCISCPPNDDTTLASQIVFTPIATGIYTIAVSRAAATPPSAGTYGRYDIKITSP